MIEVKGANQLADLSKALKASGAKDLQRELYAAINRAVKPLREDIKQSARTQLPRRGGLAAGVAKSRLRTQRRANSRTAGVRIVATNKWSLYHLNQGQIRHGNGTVQRIEPGWWTEPTEGSVEEVRREILKAMNDITAKIGRT